MTRRLLFALGLLAMVSAALPTATAGADGVRVLRVGTWHHSKGGYTTIQAAVNAAKPGDWILVGPGDYHEAVTPDTGVLIDKPAIHLRGMDRNGVVVDGTRPGRSTCASAADAQDFGPPDSTGQPGGRNGVLVKPNSPGGADGVTLDNFTVCNFLGSASGARGNAVWFNGGDGTGHQWLGAFSGSYLTTSTTYSDPSGGLPAAMYGLFAGNTHGPGSFTESYAANMADAAAYVGACPDCNVTLSHLHLEHSATAYSGTNSGGHLVITDSEVNDNLKGIAPNSQNDDDAPSPQDGACPVGTTPSVPNAGTCTVIQRNWVHDNNNPSVPRWWIAGAGIGTGILIAGGRNNTIIDNRVSHNGLFGIVVVDWPDTNAPFPAVANCNGGILIPPVGPPQTCYFQAFGNEVARNVLDGNGFFGNTGEADLAFGGSSATPGNCFHDNTSPSGEPTGTPPNIQTVDGHCGGPSVGDPRVGVHLACSGVTVALNGPPCPTQAFPFPTATGVTLAPIPVEQTMPDPCAGVPRNPWCQGASTRSAGAEANITARGTLPATGSPSRPGWAVALVGLALALRAAPRLVRSRVRS